MRYELYYWPKTQGRGEFPRLVLEDAGADYVEVGRQPDGVPRMLAAFEGKLAALLPLAPPFLVAGDLALAQSSAIARFLGERLGLAPKDEQGRLVAQTIGLTIDDLVDETHDTHHPITNAKAYEDQKEPALARATAFRELRIPKYLGYLERNLERNGSGTLVGPDVTYVDLAAFQVVEGLTYAFPKAMEKVRPTLTRLYKLRDLVAARPRLSSYLSSERRLAFNEHGIFRRYPELDG